MSEILKFSLIHLNSYFGLKLKLLMKRTLTRIFLLTVLLNLGYFSIHASRESTQSGLLRKGWSELVKDNDSLALFYVGKFNRLDLSSLAAGTYILEIIGTGNSFKKVIVHY